MSATGRNLAGNERRLDDFYETPAWVTRAILPHLKEPKTVLEPAAGNGAIVRVVQRYWPKSLIGGIEIHRERAVANNWIHADALTVDHWNEPQEPELVITNPPFSLAMEFVVKAHLDCPNAMKAFLLHLAFLESKTRAAFHRENASDVYILPKRPSFTNGGTDMAAYAWFVWGSGRGGRWQILELP